MFSFKSMEALLQEGIRRRLFNNAVIGVVFKSGTRTFFSSQGDGEQQKDKVFDIASVTKFLIALLHYVLQSKGLGVTNQTKVSTILPMSGDYVDDLSVEHLLCFRTLFNKGYPAKEAMQNGLAAFRKDLLRGGLKVRPGDIFSYGNLHTIVLGWLLESLTRESLYGLFDKHLKNPLQMSRTVQDPTVFGGDVVQSHFDLQAGTIHDPAARLAHVENGSLLGSAGLFSSADDLLSVLEMLLLNGVFQGAQILPGEFVQSFPNGKYSGFGNGLPIWSTFRSNLEANCPRHHDGSGLFKLGHTGCIVATLPSHGFAFTMLTDFLVIPRSPEEEKAQRSILNHLFASVPGTLRY